MISASQNNPKTNRTKLIELIQKHQRIKKNFEIQDAYKLLYQGVFGIGHILNDPEMALKYLEKELDLVSAVDDENLIEEISVSGKIVRLNLRPYKYRNANVDRLFQAMLRSAENISGSREEFLDLWNEFKHAVFNGELNFDKTNFTIFDHKVKSDNYPAMHHSANYKEANCPAYRVLKSNLAKQLLSQSG